MRRLRLLLLAIGDKKFWFLCWLIGGVSVCMVPSCFSNELVKNGLSVFALAYIFGGLILWIGAL